MRNLSISWVLATLFALGCTQKDANEPQVTIAGKLENVQHGEIDVYWESQDATTTIQEDGTFLIQLVAEDPETYYFRTGRDGFELFLSPGDSVYVYANSEDFEGTFRLEGDHVAESNYLREKTKFYFESDLGDVMELMSQDLETYFQKKELFFDQQREMWEKQKAQYDFNQDFQKVEEAYFEYEPLLYDLRYPMTYAYVNEISQDSVDFPHDEIKAKLSALDLGREDLLSASSYTSLIERIIEDKAKEIIEKDSTLGENQKDGEKAIYLAVDNLLKNQHVKDHYLYNHISRNLEYMGPVAVKDAYDKFMAENQSPKLAAKLKRSSEKWEKIGPGKEVPDFTFENMEGEEVKLSDLRGTLVYIDIWATWCGPCIGEHPHWDKMKEEYKDKPVSFLTVSIDDSREPWEKMVKAKNMEGLQWFAENAWKAEIAKHFMVNAIPRFLLLDKEGKVLDPSAERPSGKIRETIDLHL